MRLTAVTNGQLDETRLRKVLKEITPFVDAILVREKQKPPQEYLALVKALIADGIPKEKLWIHSRTDIACMTGVHHLHLPEKGVTVREVKESYPFLKVGQAVHSLSAAKQAEEEGADYVMFGHIFPTDSKKGRKARGVEELKEVTSTLCIPVIAIGGITIERMKDLHAAHAKGAAVMSGIINAAAPAEAVRQYQKEAKA
ncbi:thiazole tautomerase [Halobacillus andaensis]|uniref:Thiazole tautomerase n=1 Tax=Halobacillus andaensis TaxID=1176239 RepID=A0A917EWN5_HALAA|nr:thiamine phosphate synthase [Halobacillus andaensis]MBP2006434.1 thiazole tautomerase (transcriptional regulator TenI) [Halobacillus andaensis]GGF27369.1 thiazole tautomerase [Halobacillus andaensis]